MSELFWKLHCINTERPEEDCNVFIQRGECWLCIRSAVEDVKQQAASDKAQSQKALADAELTTVRQPEWYM